VATLAPQPRDRIVAGVSSARGVEGLRALVANLPPDLPAAMAVVLPATEISAVLAEPVREQVEVDTAPAPSRVPATEYGMANSIDVNPAGTAGAGGPCSVYSCPDCNGSLVEVSPGQGHVRCRVGHAWSAHALLAAQGGSLQRAQWTALRSLDEKVALATRMYEQSVRRGNDVLTVRYERLVSEATEAAEVLREHLTSPPMINATDAGA
jgi:two-component system chemotaxis response regulator CheB